MRLFTCSLGMGGWLVRSAFLSPSQIITCWVAPLSFPPSIFSVHQQDSMCAFAESAFSLFELAGSSSSLQHNKGSGRTLNVEAQGIKLAGPWIYTGRVILNAFSVSGQGKGEKALRGYLQKMRVAGKEFQEKVKQLVRKTPTLASL